MKRSQKADRMDDMLLFSVQVRGRVDQRNCPADAVIPIHHLRKEKADDVFNQISGTTAISGAVDSSFTLVEERRDSGRVRLSYIGRDIEQRELELQRNSENVWELVADSSDQPRKPEEAPDQSLVKYRYSFSRNIENQVFLKAVLHLHILRRYSYFQILAVVSQNSP